MTTENKKFMEAMQQLRRSSAASPHKLKKNKGTRKVKKEKSIKDQLDNPE